MNHNSHSKNGVSVIDYFCIGFGAIIGVGWAVSINDWMKDSGGPVPAAFGYILGMIVMVPLALCFCELIPMFPVAGGSMTFSYTAFSAPIGALTGWAAFGASVSLLPWEAIQITDILGYLIPNIKYGTPLYSFFGSEIHLPTILIGIALSILLYVLNLRGLQAAALFQRYLVIILVGTSIIGAVSSLIGGRPENLLPLYESNALLDSSFREEATHSSFLGGAFAVLVSAPFFLAGFETIPQGIEAAGGNVKRVGKTVVLSVVCACLFYAILLVCFGFGIPWKTFLSLPRPAVANLFLLLYSSPIGNALYWMIIIGALAGLLTSWNGFFSASANLLMSMSRGSLLPEALQHQTSNGSAKNGLLVCLILSIIGPFLGPNLIDSITCFSASAFVLSWTMTAWSLVQLRRTQPDADRPYRLPGGIAVGLFAAISSSIVLIGMFIPLSPFYVGQTASIMFFLWMLIGMILFLLSANRRKGLTKQELLKRLLEANSSHQ